MRFTWTIVEACLPLALSGCADFKGPPSLDMRLPEIFEQKPVSQPQEPALTKLQTDWWTHTDDKTLIATIRALEKLNLSLEQAQSRLRAARLDTREWDYLPSVTATTSGQFDRLIEGDTAVGGVNQQQSGGKKTTGYYSAKLDASWEIPIYGQLRDEGDIADANIRKAEASVLVAAGEFELSKSDMYPKLSLAGNLSQLGNITGNPLPGNTTIDVANAAITELQAKADIITQLTALTKALGGTSAATTNEKKDD